MRAFADLTERGRARRLRPMVLEALEDYAVKPARVRLLTNSFNGVFRIDAVDGTRYVMKVMLPTATHGIRATRSEVAFVSALACDTDLSLPRPVANVEGELITTVDVPGVPQPRHCVLSTWVPGVDLATRRSPESWSRFGALQATMHDFASQWSPPPWFDVIRYDELFHYGEPCVLFADEHRGLFSNEQLSVLERGIAVIDDGLREIYRGGRAIVTHGDLHQWNVKVARGNLTPIDFEDLQWALPVQDLGTTLYYSRWHDDWPVMFDAFRSGYEAISAWPRAGEEELDLCVRARGVDLLNFVLYDPETELADTKEFIQRIVDRVRPLVG